MNNLTRRSLLKTTAAGAAAIALGATATSAFAKSSERTAGAMSLEHSAGNHAACAHNHHALGHKLSTLIASPEVNDTVKNHAIKTASCPTCGTGIAPTGLGLAVSTWV